MLSPTDRSTQSAAPALNAPLEDLLRQIGQRNQESFCQLYSRTSPQVYAMLFSVVRDADRAERITERVFLDVWWRVAEFDGSVSSARSWLTMLTRARLIDDLRHHRLERSRRPTTRQHPGSPAEAWVRSIRRDAPDIDHLPRTPASAA